MKKFSKNKLAILLIIFLALILRLYGINWDQNQHLHPDERFLTMLTQAIQFPYTLFDYLTNPQNTKMIPYNIGYNFYVYGTLPIYVTKFLSQFIIFDRFDYNNVTLVGRLISGILDVSIVFLIYKISKNIFNEKIALLGSFIYSISVLPIQLAHFYAVDTFLTFFLVLSFYFLTLLIRNFNLRKKDQSINKSLVMFSVLIGISFGFAIASKISALLFSPIITLGFLYIYLKRRKFLPFFTYSFLSLIFCYLSLRFADPHIFAKANILSLSLNPQFVKNIKELSSYSKPGSLFPPGIQWIGTIPVIFPLKNIVLWGLGLPLGISAVLATFYSTFKISVRLTKSLRKNKLFPLFRFFKLFEKVNYRNYLHFLILLWVLLLFFYQSVQTVKTMRYFYPIYPFLAILAANFLYQCSKNLKNKIKNNNFLLLFYSSTLLLLLIWPLSFIAIYSRPHSRVAASEWIYQNIPKGSTISCEYWDDCLPLPLGNNYPTTIYNIETLDMFSPDSKTKWGKLDSQLDNIDYLILSSNRVWGSVDNVPQRFYKTTQFYKDLFAGRTEFRKIVEFNSYPTMEIGNWKLEIKDEVAEEAFTVYDHPKILIFKK